MGKGVLIDLTRCIGCRGCQTACKEWNERSATHTVMEGDYTNPMQLSSQCYTRIRFVEDEAAGEPVWSFVKDQCLHCKDPACVSACPVAALAKSKAGPVTYDYDRCIGCRYCMVACPFQVPKYEWTSTEPWVQKCSFCSERIKDKMAPACTKVCPTGALFYDEYDAVMAEAEGRIKIRPDRYVDHIYGKDEAGGTSWIYLSGVPFHRLGFRTDIPKIAFPDLTWSLLSQVPATAVGLLAGLSAIAYVKNRREET